MRRRMLDPEKTAGTPRGDRRVVADDSPSIRVIVPTEGGPISVVATDLIPLEYRQPA